MTCALRKIILLQPADRAIRKRVFAKTCVDGSRSPLVAEGATREARVRLRCPLRRRDTTPARRGTSTHVELVTRAGIQTRHGCVDTLLCSCADQPGDLDFIPRSSRSTLTTGIESIGASRHWAPRLYSGDSLSAGRPAACAGLGVCGVMAVATLAWHLSFAWVAIAASTHRPASRPSFNGDERAGLMRRRQRKAMCWLMGHVVITILRAIRLTQRFGILSQRHYSYSCCNVFTRGRPVCR